MIKKEEHRELAKDLIVARKKLTDFMLTMRGAKQSKIMTIVRRITTVHSLLDDIYFREYGDKESTTPYYGSGIGK